MKGERRVDHKTRALVDLVDHYQRRAFWSQVGLLVSCVALACMPLLLFFIGGKA